MTDRSSPESGVRSPEIRVLSLESGVLSPEPQTSSLQTTDSSLCVIIDPGHGGRDPGACVYGPRTGDLVRESDLNLRFAFQLEAALRRKSGVRSPESGASGLQATDSGLTVVLTRYDDIDVPLAARARAAEEADLFISIHHNSAGSSKAAGFEVFVSPHDSPLRDQSSRLAEAVTRAAAPALRRWGIPLRVPPVKQADYYVLRRAPCPAILIEVCFMSNPTELATAQDNRFRAAVSQAIAEGIYAAGIPPASGGPI